MRPLLPLTVLMLVGCGQAEPDPAPSPEPERVVTGPRTLIAAGLGELELGAKIEGPRGPEVTDTASGPDGDLFEIVSYVACPDSADDAMMEASASCVPSERGPDTVYTYVHRVTLADGLSGPVAAFRMTAPATGFNNTVGYDREQAEAALGEGYTIDVSVENERLVWRIEVSDGWQAGETMTFFWRSTVPPEGPGEGYCLDIEGECVAATGPLPPQDTAAS